MKAKVTIMVEFNDEKHLFFEKNEDADYNDVVDLINNASTRASEDIEQKRIDEIDNEDE